MKKALIIFCALLLVLAVAAVIIFLPKLLDGGSKDDINGIVNTPIALSEAEDYVVELSEENFDDDFSMAFMKSTTMTVLSVDGEKKTASVELAVPDIARIMEESLPDDTSGDFDAILDAYFEEVCAKIASEDKDRLIVSTVELPIEENDGKSKMSIEGVELLDFEKIVLDVLLKISREVEE